MLISLLYVVLGYLGGSSGADTGQSKTKAIEEGLPTLRLPQDLPNVTESGYLPLSNHTSDALFYVYYEAQDAITDSSKQLGPPIIVWLQGGPGCSSQLGNFYTLGPYRVNKSLILEPNLGKWNQKYDLLFIDQPVGTGFSIAGEKGIPTDMLETAADMYTGLQYFFRKHKDLQQRPLFITGESYAGKYVPAIGHFILEMEAAAAVGRKNGSQVLQQRTQLSQRAGELSPPLFNLTGLAIGNGLTDPATQVLQHADTAFYMGMIDLSQRSLISDMQLQAAQLISEGRWKEAHAQREELMGWIVKWSGVGTLEDMRRYRDYDADKTVDRYLNQLAVKKVLGVPEDFVFESCSGKVGVALGPDVMKSVKPLIPDILQSVPLLLYQGQMDAQDGVASNEPWINSLQWHGKDGFKGAERELWRMSKADVAGSDAKESCNASWSQSQVSTAQGLGSAPSASQQSQLATRQQNLIDGGLMQPPSNVDIGDAEGFQNAGCVGEKEEVVVGYWKQHSTLTHAIVRNAGHMVPHDQPIVAQAMIERWIEGVLKHQ